MTHYKREHHFLGALVGAARFLGPTISKTILPSLVGMGMSKLMPQQHKRGGSTKRGGMTEDVRRLSGSLTHGTLITEPSFKALHAKPDQIRPGLPRKYAKEGMWMKTAVKRPGALHRDLGIPMDKKIPSKVLNKASHSRNPHLKREAVLAKTFNKYRRKG